MEIIKYGLKYKGKLLKVYSRSNGDAEFCNESTYTLEEDGQDWLVDNFETVKQVKYEETSWYNSSYDFPVNKYDRNQVEIVKVTIVIDETPIEDGVIKVKLKDTSNKFHALITNHNENLPIPTKEYIPFIYVENYDEEKYKLVAFTRGNCHCYDNRYLYKKDFEIAK